MDLPCLFEGGGHAQLDVAHERLDGGEPGVAGGGAVAALLLDVGEEGQHQGSVELLEAELRWPQTQALAGEDQPELEGVGVGLAGVAAAALRDRHVLAQEAGDQGSDGRHGAPSPLASASPAAAMSVISSGVASRYQ